MALPLGVGLPEVDLLQTSQHVPGGEHRADRTEHHRRAEHTEERPASGLYEPTSDMNSPQNPARPGRPSEAIAVKARIPPMTGISFMLPPRRDISLVW